MPGIAPEKYRCPHCGMKFRYKCNQKGHEKKCSYFFTTPNKFIDVHEE